MGTPESGLRRAWLPGRARKKPSHGAPPPMFALLCCLLAKGGAITKDITKVTFLGNWARKPASQVQERWKWAMSYAQQYPQAQALNSAWMTTRLGLRVEILHVNEGILRK